MRIPDNPVFETEDRDMHPAFLSVIVEILSVLKIRPSCFMRPTLKSPTKVPDVGIGAPELTSLNWKSISILGELKLPSNIKDAAVESWAYLKKAIRSRKSDVTAKYPPVAFGSDFRQIFFIAGKYDPKLDLINLVEPLIAQCELFPENWLSMKTPTSGFKFLCHVLNLTYLKPVLINVNNHDTVAKAILYEDESTGVYIVRGPDKKQYVVKVARKKNGYLAISLEKNAYMELSDTEFKEFMVPARFDIEVQDGFALEYAESLEEIEDVNGLDDYLIPHFVTLLKALQCLHCKVQRCHGDIRPGNIVIYHKEAKFIDLGTVVKLQGKLYFRQGQHDFFWPPDPEIYWENVSKAREWDLASLGMTFLYLSLQLNNKLFLQKGKNILAFNVNRNLKVQDVAFKLLKEMDDTVRNGLEFDSNIYNNYISLLQSHAL